MLNLKRKKFHLERYKKSLQGIIDFATLIEQAEPMNRSRIIEQAQEEDSEFLWSVMKKVVFFEELTYVDEGILAEVLSKTSPKILAFAIRGMPEEFQKKMLKQMGFREMRQLQEEQDKMGADVPVQLVLGARIQVLKTARALEAQGKFIFELNDCPRFKTRRRKKNAVSSTS
ncbi:MAG: hypothetical protein HY537_18885 [Deltaproteobacteria bacterium]|nr:hypothetical protein [Deltaproteobacteria bacterium]